MIRLTGQLRDLDGDARIFRANAIQQGTNKLIGSTAANSNATRSRRTASTSRS